MLFYTHTNHISIKSHSHICGWKTQSIAMEILVWPQRAGGTAKQPCCSEITHLTSSALLLRYLGRLKKSLWAEVALQLSIKITQPVVLLSHFQKKKKKTNPMSSKSPCTDHNLWCLVGARFVTNQRRAAWPGCSWDSTHHFHLANRLGQLCTCLRANSGLESRLELSQSHEAFSEEGCSQLEQV